MWNESIVITSQKESHEKRFSSLLLWIETYAHKKAILLGIHEYTESPPNLKFFFIPITI